MGAEDSLNYRIEEVNTNHASNIPESFSDKIYNSIVRIEDSNKNTATGFFMKANINNHLTNLLLTCNHVITKNHIIQKDIIKISYGKINEETTKKIKLNDNKRFIKFFEPPIDITVIEIIKDDKIPEKKFLYPDLY